MPSPTWMEAEQQKDETAATATMEEGHGLRRHKRRRLVGQQAATTQLVEEVDDQQQQQEEEAAAPTCSICLQPWTCNGDHRIPPCIPCGHVYGRSCLEKWLVHVLQRGTGQAKCPQCGEEFEPHRITNLYAPGINIWDGCCKNHANEVGEYYNREYEGLKTQMESTIAKQGKDLEELDVLVKSVGRQFESLESSLKTFLLSNGADEDDGYTAACSHGSRSIFGEGCP
uniref:RING-type domain-containing protein n=1 Tax=Oryza barthii TaxID=65489 RepID=A0A0D3FCR8_9ORYZ